MKNKIYSIVTVLFISTYSLSGLCQKNNLIGHLMDAQSNTPIENATIYIQGGDREEKTSSDGQYVLNLDIGNFYKAGAALEIIINDKKYGYHKIQIIIPIDLRRDIYITPNIHFGITGIVVDKKTLEPIQGIEVSFTPAKYNGKDPQKLPSTTTDKFGRFFLSLKKDLIKDTRFAHFVFKDSTNCYEFQHGIKSINAYQEIFLKRKSDIKPKKRDNNDKNEDEVIPVPRYDIDLGINDPKMPIRILNNSKVLIKGKSTESSFKKKIWLGIFNKKLDLFRPLTEIRQQNFHLIIQASFNIELIDDPENVYLVLVEITAKDHHELIKWQSLNGSDTLVKCNNFFEKFNILKQLNISITQNFKS